MLIHRPGLLLTIAILGIFLATGSAVAFADHKDIVAEGTYTMGEGETMKVAQERALTDAKRMAVE